MKKIGSIVLMTFALFFIASCNSETGDILPSLELIGESVVDVEQYSDFVDPGVDIIGDFDLDVVVDSNVDTSIVGVYTITYTITYLGVDYDISRTVRVVELGTEITPEIQLIGDSIVEVEQYTDFSDQGVDLINDLGLEVVIESNVDTSVIGSYTITYTITYNDVDYSVSRTVNVVSPVTVIIPTIALVGDAVMQVEQYTTFVDPGVEVDSDVSLEVVVESDVDTTMIGSYTIIYTLTYDEIDYSVSRTVNVVLPVTVIIPTITLVGDAVMQVEQDSLFVDPGVIVTGDLGLEVAVVSDVDTTTEGTYTITYTITYMDIDYTVSRTVEVVFELVVITPDLFVISLEEDYVTGRTVSVVVTVDDADGVINNAVVELYHGDTLIDSTPFVNGVNSITFNELDDSTTYTVKVNGDYLDSNGITAYLYGYDLDVTTLAVGELSFVLVELTISTSSIDFSIVITDEDDKLTDLSVRILDGDTVIETLELFDEINIGELDNSFVWVSLDELDELTDYTVQIMYSYLPVGESQEVEGDSISLSYTTLESFIPNIISHEVNERYYSLEGELILDYSDYEGYYVWAKLYKDGVFVDTTTLSNDYTTYEFDYLDGNTEYTIEVYADFTITSTGGIYESVLIDSITATTLEQGVLEPPTVENVVITKTSDSITIEFDLIDVDNALERGIIYLYRGTSSYGNLDYVVGHNVITFDSSIYDNTLYTINIKADYTGNGSYTSIYEEDVYILPVVSVNNFEAVDMFYSGDNVVMKLVLNNNEDVDIAAVTINGERFSTFLFPSDNKTLYIDLGVKLTGSYPISLQDVIITFNEVEYSIALDEARDVVVYMPGSTAPETADVVVIDIVPQENFVTVDRDNPDVTTDVIVDVYLENEYNLTVTGIKIGGVDYYENDITVISYTHIQITAKIAFSSSNSSNNSLYYSNVTFERNMDIIVGTSGSHLNAFVYKIYDFDNNGTTANDIVHISTPEQLMEITSGTQGYVKVFILDNDIDMTGYDWNPIGTYDDAFIGAFNGNGYTISNVTITKTFAENNDFDYVGFFGYTSAFISDLTIDNINITVSSHTSNYLYIGALAGKSVGDVVNVQVINSSITVDGIIKGAVGGLIGNHRGDLIRNSADTDIVIVTVTNETTNMRLYVGGLVGDKSYEDVRRSYASGDITITISSLQTVFVGGLLGTASDSTGMISNSYATGEINVTGDYYSRVGGLIGNSFTSTIVNSYASGDVSASAGTIGGLIGESDGYVYSSFATGTVSCDSGTVGKIFGRGNNYRLDLMFTYDGQLAYNSGTITVGSDYYYTYLGEASSAQFNNIDYYTDFLGWSSDIYDFSNLDIENEDLPITTM